MKKNRLHAIRAYFCGKDEGFQFSDFIDHFRSFDSLIEPCQPANADFLFVDHSPRSIREMLSIPDKGQIRVLLAREAVSPDFNLFDYALTFDATIQSFRHFRPHTLLAFAKDARQGDLDIGAVGASRPYSQRTGFCDFIYGNRKGHPMRASLFRELSQRFQGVEPLGTFLNNSRGIGPPLGKFLSQADWRREKIKVQEGYLFSIAAENARFPGYTTEKLLHPLMAGSIPVYWGNPLVCEEFNESRFLVFDGTDFDGLAERIESIGSSQEAWIEVVQQPSMTENQRIWLAENQTNLSAWFAQFFQLRVYELQIRPRGWYPDWYSDVAKTGYRSQKFSASRAEGALRRLMGFQRS